MPVYPGDSPPTLTQTGFFEKDGYNDFHISTGMHVGTHMDSPLHMLENGKRLSEFPVEKFFGKGHLIDARKKTINASLLRNKEISEGDIVLIMTGFYAKFSERQYYEKYPEIEENFANKIVELGVSIVGMDTPSPDRVPFKIHKILLGSDVLIIENLANLDKLSKTLGQNGQFRVIALPTKFAAEAAPVRVIAEIC